MFAFQHSACFATAIDTVLQGAFTGPDRTDVICIKESSVELLQTVVDSQSEVLKTRFRQTLFGSFSDTKVVKCTFGANDDEKRTSTDVDVDMGSSSEDDLSELEIPFTSRTRCTHDRIRGNDVLVSLLENGYPVFWTLTSSNGSLEETGRLEPLAKIVLETFIDGDTTKMGCMLAVDPHSRAIAVGALQNHITVLFLKETMSRTNFDPVTASALIKEEGIIWHMEFLHTSTSSRERILLAAVVYSEVDKVCRLVIYAIDATNPFDIKAERIGRLPLEKGSPLPVLLIPLKDHPEAFLLLTEQQISYIMTEDVTSGNTFYATSLIPRKFGERECPLFTAYAIPTETSALPYIYLGSSEGAFFRVDLYADNLVTEVIQVGTIHPVSKSMCCLGSMEIIEDDKSYLADVLLYAGEGADNQVIAVKRNLQDGNNLITLQNLVNRAPMKDLETCSAEDAIFACTGLNEQGAISITTESIQAEKIASSSGWHGVNRLWSTNIGLLEGKTVSCLVASSALDTRLLTHVAGVLKDESHTKHITEDTPTVIAGTVAVDKHQVFVQVCAEHIRLHKDFSSTSEAVTWSLKSIPELGEYSITLAALCDDDQNPRIAVYLSAGQRNVLLFLKISIDHPGCPLQVQVQSETSVSEKEASFISYVRLQNQPTLVLGTFEPALLFYQMQSDSIMLINQYKIGVFHGQADIPHSGVLVHRTDSQSGPLLLIGTRDGNVLYIDAENLVSGKVRNDVKAVCRKLGEGSVQLLSEGPDSALALCERVWRIRVERRKKDVDIKPVLLPAFKAIHAISMVDLESALLCIAADGYLHLFRLASNCSVNTCKIIVGETPLKMLLDKSSNKAFVVTRTIKDERTRCMAHYLRLIDLSRTQDKPNNTLLLPSEEFSMNSHILSLAEWSIPKGEKTYRYICLGLGQANPQEQHRGMNWTLKGGTTHGALMIYRVKHSNDGDYLLKPVLRQQYDTGGVFAICSHPEGLLFSTGAVLCLYQLDPKQGKLVEVAKKMTRFAIKSISVHGSRICVASFTDSITFYDYNAETKTIEFVKSDTTSRTINHSLMISDRLAVGALGLGDIILLRDNPDDSSFEQRLLQECLVQSMEIAIRPVLGSLRPKSLLSDVNGPDAHLLPWSESESCSKPILVGTVPGGIIAIHRISQELFDTLRALQQAMMDYGLFSFYALGALKQKLERSHVIYGDLLAFYPRLSSDQQHEILREADIDNEHKIQSIAKSILGLSDEDLGDRTTLDLLCDIIQILLNQC